MENAVNERIRVFIKQNFKSTRDFALKIEVPASTIQGMFNRDTKPSFDVIESIINTFEFLNAEWLITGRGEMIKNEKKIENSPNSTITGDVSGELINNSKNIIKGDISSSMITGENDTQKNEIKGSGNTINGLHNVKMGDNSYFNQNDLSNLTQMLKDKDFIISKLRKQIEEKHNDCTKRVDQMDRQCKEMLVEKDRFIEKVLNEKDSTIKMMTDREAGNLKRMDIMHEKLFELQNALISLIDKINK